MPYLDSPDFWKPPFGWGCCDGKLYDWPAQDLPVSTSANISSFIAELRQSSKQKEKSAALLIQRSRFAPEARAGLPGNNNFDQKLGVIRTNLYVV
jgi:hypothetical protein